MKLPKHIETLWAYLESHGFMMKEGKTWRKDDGWHKLSFRLNNYTMSLTFKDEPKTQWESQSGAMLYVYEIKENGGMLARSSITYAPIGWSDQANLVQLNNKTQLDKVILMAKKNPDFKVNRKINVITDKSKIHEPLDFLDELDPDTFKEDHDAVWDSMTKESHLVPKLKYKYRFVEGIALIQTVAITADGTVNTDAISDPEQEPWFLLKCTDNYQGTFYAISNGDCYYPVNMKTVKPRVTTKNDTPLNKMSQAMICKLIKLHVEAIFGGKNVEVAST